MPKHSLKLLFLLAGFSVVPASADCEAPKIASTHADNWADGSGVACPYERARLAAQAAAANARPTTITLTDRVSADAPLLGRGSALLNP